MLKKISSMWNARAKREDGFTLIEVLVTTAIVLLVSFVVVFTINQVTKTTDTFSSSNSTQEDVSNAMAVATRDIGTLKRIVKAEDYTLHMVDGHGDHVVYGYADAGKPADVNKLKAGIPDRNGVTKKPDAGMIDGLKAKELKFFYELRSFGDQPKSVLTILATGVDESQSGVGMPLFTYYGESGNIMETGVPENLTKDIKRIAVRIAATNTDRDKPIELVTSVNLYQSVASVTGSLSDAVAPAAPFLKGELPRPKQKATLWWEPVSGATSYTLYRDGAAIASVGSTSDLKVPDPNRPWGSTSAYTVIAEGPAGHSAQSNVVRLTVVPEKPAFININPKGVVGANFTVARGLTNYLMWTPRTGATGYFLQDVTSTPTELARGTATKATHPGRSYGDVKKYVVTAFNVGENGSGGNSLTSDPVTLISPPIAPVLTGTHLNGDRNLSWSKPATALGYTLNRATATPVTTAWSQGFANANTTSYADTSAVVAVDFNYSVTAYNDAGVSPTSNTQNLKPNPGATASVTISSNNGDRIISRGTATNAVSYYLDRTAPTSKAMTTNMATSATDKEVLVSANFTYTVKGWNKTGFGPESKVSINPRPSAPTVTVDDFTKGQDGRNIIRWSAVPNATSYNYQRDNTQSGSTAATTWTDGSPGHDSLRNYRTEACNYTGCSAISPNVAGKQPPAAFTVTAKEWKSSGQTTYPTGGAYSQSRIAFHRSEAQFSWGGSSGADRIRVTANGAQIYDKATGVASNANWWNTAGAKADIVVTAYGNTSGLNRVITKKVTASSTQILDTYVRAMNKGAANRSASNTRWWTRYHQAAAGSVSAIQSVETTTTTDGFDKETPPGGVGDNDGLGRWANWSAGQSKYSGYYTPVGATAQKWKGGIQGVRTLSPTFGGYSDYDLVDARSASAGNNALGSALASQSGGSSWITFSAMRLYSTSPTGIGFGWKGCPEWKATYQGYGDVTCEGNYVNQRDKDHEAVFGREGYYKDPS